MPFAWPKRVNVVTHGNNEYELLLTTADLHSALAEWLDEHAASLPLTLHFSRASQPTLTLTTAQELRTFALAAQLIAEQLIASPELPPVYVDVNGKARITGTDILVHTINRAWQAGVADAIILAEYPELDTAKLDAVWAWLRRT